VSACAFFSWRRAARGLSLAACLVAAPTALANGYLDEVDCTTCASSVDDCGCGVSSGAAGYGYCINTPMTAELAAQMAAMAKSMEASGFIYAPGVHQFYQGVGSGGQEQTFEYGGKVDQFFILDSTKLGLWDGATMIMHAETRFGQDVNFDAVGFAPVNIAMLYPNATEHDTAITNLTFAQALSEDIQVTAGKFNAVDLFYSLYPQTGRGVTGFMNASMVIPLGLARVAPLSFLGAGAMRYHGKLPQAGVLVYDTNNCATTSGFDNLFDNGANILGFWRHFTEMGGLPASHMVGGFWSTGEFVAFDPTGFVIVPGQGIVAVPQDGAYTLIYAYEQTLWAGADDRHVGLLSQWAYADEATSPIAWSGNVGLQAQGIAAGRPHDRLGAGYFYTGVSDDLRNLLSPVIDLQDTHGVELYYTAAIAPMVFLTADLQAIEPANVDNDTAVVAGLRASIGM
jgi:porin